MDSGVEGCGTYTILSYKANYAKVECQTSDHELSFLVYIIIP